MGILKLIPSDHLKSVSLLELHKDTNRQTIIYYYKLKICIFRWFTRCSAFHPERNWWYHGRAGAYPFDLYPFVMVHFCDKVRFWVHCQILHVSCYFAAKVYESILRKTININIFILIHGPRVSSYE